MRGFTYATHVAMLVGLPFVSSSWIVVSSLVLFASGKTGVLLAATATSSPTEETFELNATRLRMLVLHTATIGMALLVAIVLGFTSR